MLQTTPNFHLFCVELQYLFDSVSKITTDKKAILTSQIYKKKCYVKKILTNELYKFKKKVVISPYFYLLCFYFNFILSLFLSLISCCPCHILMIYELWCKIFILLFHVKCIVEKIQWRKKKIISSWASSCACCTLSSQWKYISVQWKQKCKTLDSTFVWCISCHWMMQLVFQVRLHRVAARTFVAFPQVSPLSTDEWL